jgi:hypothetical protein
MSSRSLSDIQTYLVHRNMRVNIFENGKSAETNPEDEFFYVISGRPQQRKKLEVRGKRYLWVLDISKIFLLILVAYLHLLNRFDKLLHKVLRQRMVSVSVTLLQHRVLSRKLYKKVDNYSILVFRKFSMHVWKHLLTSALVSLFCKNIIAW